MADADDAPGAGEPPLSPHSRAQCLEDFSSLHCRVRGPVWVAPRVLPKIEEAAPPRAVESKDFIADRWFLL